MEGEEDSLLQAPIGIKNTLNPRQKPKSTTAQMFLHKKGELFFLIRMTKTSFLEAYGKATGMSDGHTKIVLFPFSYDD
jgi:hypothetical protein